MLRSLRIENLVLIREAELSLAPGLNVITGETGAGKTILAQAVGLLLGSPGETSYIGPEGMEAYVEADFDTSEDVVEGEGAEALAELRPPADEGLVLARRVFSDGRTRAYAWGRAVAREDVARAAEQLISMSGQFEQRRLSRPSYQLDVLDSYCGEEQLQRRRDLRRAWRELATARRAHDELLRGRETAAEHIAELRALVEDSEGVSAEREDLLRSESERLRHVTELAHAASAAASAVAPEDSEGALEHVAQAGVALADVDGLAPELDQVAVELREVELLLRECSTAIKAFLVALDADPGRLEEVEAELARVADLRRRYRASSTVELEQLAAAARDELAAVDDGADPLAVAADVLGQAERSAAQLADALRATRVGACEPFARAVAAELQGMGMGEGEFRVELRERELSASGGDEAIFLVRANHGLPFAPAAETASGGELSRIALSIAAVAGGNTMVFDEIDAGIGGQTAHAVAEALVRLARRAQVVTITHLPQIASRADRHFSVEKVPGDPTHTRIRELGAEERAAEIERMLGGREFLARVADGTGPRG